MEIIEKNGYGSTAIPTTSDQPPLTNPSDNDIDGNIKTSRKRASIESYTGDRVRRNPDLEGTSAMIEAALNGTPMIMLVLQARLSTNFSISYKLNSDIKLL